MKQFINSIKPIITFSSKPEPIPGDMRPLWRINVILLALNLASRGNKSSFHRLALFDWALRSEENQNNFLNLIESNQTPDEIAIRNDPTFQKAIDFAIGEKLIINKSGRITLTLQGINVVTRIIEMDSIFLDEISYLRKIGKSLLTESLVNSLYQEN